MRGVPFRTLIALTWMVILGSPDRAAATGEPRLELSPRQAWVLYDLPDLLAGDEVKPHLLTGLTTSFNFQLSIRGVNGGEPIGAAKVDVRYELWDEVFHVAVLDLDGRREPRVVPSFDALRAWWGELRLTILASTPEHAAAPKARVTVDVVPFSQSESAETRRWLADSVDAGAGGSGPEEVAGLGEEPFEPLDRVLSLLLTTSIKRRALLSFAWSLPVPESAG